MQHLVTGWWDKQKRLLKWGQEKWILQAMKTKMQLQVNKPKPYKLDHVHQPCIWHCLALHPGPNTDNCSYTRLSISVWHQFHNMIKLVICKPVCFFLKKAREQFDLSRYNRHWCRWFKNKAFNQGRVLLKLLDDSSSSLCSLSVVPLWAIIYRIFKEAGLHVPAT